MSDGFISAFVEALFVRLRDFVFGDEDDQFAEDYAEAASNRFITPDQSDSAIQPMLELNELLTGVAILLIAFYIVWLIAKAGMGLLRGSQAIFTGIKLLIGLGILAINVQLIFALFDFSTELVNVLFHFRGEQIAEGGTFGSSVIGTLSVLNETFMTGGLALLFSLLSTITLLAALYLRWVFLHLIVAFAPIIIATWIFGGAIGIGAVGLSAALRAIFFTVPLAGGLFVIELINPGSSIASGLFQHTINSVLVLGTIWATIKLSIAGRAITGPTKKAAGVAALLGAGYALGGKAMAKKVGVANSFGTAGIPLSRAIGEGGGGGGGGGGGYQDPRDETATNMMGEGSPSADDVDHSDRSEAEIWGKSWEQGVTPENERYANNDRWGSDADLLQHMEPHQTNRGRYQSVVGPQGEPEDLNPSDKNARGGGTMELMQSDGVATAETSADRSPRTDEEWEEYWEEGEPEGELEPDGNPTTTGDNGPLGGAVNRLFGVDEPADEQGEQDYADRFPDPPTHPKDKDSVWPWEP